MIMKKKWLLVIKMSWEKNLNSLKKSDSKE